METKIIYIAGKVSGEPIAECTMKFGDAEKKWRQQGYDVLNPLTIVNNWRCPWEEAMRYCIQSLCMAKEVYFLKDWKDSEGAKLEHTIAKKLKLKIHYQK